MASEILDKITPRDTAQQASRMSRHSAFVGVSKYVMIGLSVLLVAVVFIVPALHDDTTAARVVFTTLESGDAGNPKMSNPQFQGMDARNKPYMVTAKSAEQMEEGKIKLETIQADITLANDSWIAFLSEKGTFDPEANTLVLPEKVDIFHDDGYEMSTRNVLVNMEVGKAGGDELVKGHGPLGKIQADGFRVNMNDEHVVFRPNVKMTLYPNANKKRDN